MHDIVIRGATICDGTGRDRFVGSVAVTEGKIVGISKGDGANEAARELIDADGLVLAPGVIDPHTHYDAQVVWDPLLTSSSWHGVTTAVQGNCGVGVAPLSPAMRESAMWDLVHVEDIPFQTLSAGLDWRWESFGEYLDAMDERGLGPNVAALVPLSPMRQTIMGKQAQERQANGEETKALANLFRKSLQEGGFGWSSSFLDAHVGFEGRPIACRQAGREELEALCRVMREEDTGTTQLVFNIPELGSITDDGLETIRFIREMSRRPLTYLATINHPNDPRSYLKTVEKLGDLLDSGQVVPQFPVKPLKSNFNLKTPNTLSFTDTMRGVLSGDLDSRKQAYGDPIFRDALSKELECHERSKGFFYRLRFLNGGSTTVRRLADSGKSVAELAKEESRAPVDLWLDTALDDDLQTEFTFQQAAFEPEGVRNLIQDGRFLPGLGDGGAHLNALNDTGYPTHLLGHWCRDEGAVSLEEGVRLLTSFPASVFGINRRGRIEEGFHADLMLFDPALVGCLESEYVADLPGGGSRLVAPSRGVNMTIVNGQILYREGKHTGALPGRMLRSYDR